MLVPIVRGAVHSVTAVSGRAVVLRDLFVLVPAADCDYFAFISIATCINTYENGSKNHTTQHRHTHQHL